MPDVQAWLQVSVLPRCGRVAAVLEAPSLPAAAAAFGAAALDTASAILLESYLSLAALVFLLLMSFGFARAGGVGAVPTAFTPGPPGRRDSPSTLLAQRWGAPCCAWWSRGCKPASAKPLAPPCCLAQVHHALPW